MDCSPIKSESSAAEFCICLCLCVCIPVQRQSKQQQMKFIAAVGLLVLSICASAGSNVVKKHVTVAVRRLRPFVTPLFVLVWFGFRCQCWNSSTGTSTTLSSSSSSSSTASSLQNLVKILTEGRVRAVSSILDSSSLPGRWILARVVMETSFLLEDVVVYLVIVQLWRIAYSAYHLTTAEWKNKIQSQMFLWARSHIPGLERALMDKVASSFHASADKLLHKNPRRSITLQLPVQGRPCQEILDELRHHADAENQVWRKGQVSGTVYTDGAEASTTLLSNVYALYAWSNQLHPGTWPKVNQCEAEVIAMTADLLHAPKPSTGCLTSGGTESIILAVRAHLHFYGRRRQIDSPEIICGSTAHASLDKACDLFGIRQVVVDVNDDDGETSASTFVLRASAVRRKITSNTIMIFASAPCYPQGIIDPISELSQLALEFDVGLHVDACLGGFVLPFMDDTPVYDFRLEGVTSMSADTHKYGYSTKGTSVVVYRSNTLRQGQYFVFPHWTGGMYATPTLAGSRSGALAVCAWAALVHYGRDGYRQHAQRIVQAAREMALGIKQDIPGLRLLTPHPYMVVCFASSDPKEIDIYRVQDYMVGWTLSTLQNPACVHVCVTSPMVPRVDDFLQDLAKAVERARAEGVTVGKGKGTAGIYGAGTCKEKYNLNDRYDY